MKHFAWSLFALLVVIPINARAAEENGSQKQKQEVYLDPKTAGFDYNTQGEYVGELPSAHGKLGAQVIALGDGKFQAVFLHGGLPGDGWDGKSRDEVNGERQGDRVVFQQPGGLGWSASIFSDLMTGKTADGEPFTLKQVERVSRDEGAKPPPGATVLFDGMDTHLWQNGRMDDRHLLEAGTKTIDKFQDFSLHVEFLIPFKPKARGQERGNSGIYIQDRYEVQILDTFGHKPEFNGCASTYRQTAPKLNMCYPPLRWQTYDIDFAAARFDRSGKKIKNATVTVRQNGVIVQDHTELPNKTGAGKPEGAEPGPIQLQGHGNPVFFRNVWVVIK